MEQQRILVVEDDRVGGLMLEMHLQQAGYGVTRVESGEAALDLLGRERFELLLTDLQLPNMHGMQLIGEARALDPWIAVIIVTGSASTASAITALNKQVHRYLLKPIAKPELLSNVADVLAQRRQIAERGVAYRPQHGEQAETQVLCVGPLKIDRHRHRVTHTGRPLPLSSAEFALLSYLAQHRGAVVSPLEITRHVLRYSCSLDEARALSKSHIHRLRRKIEPTPSLRLIHNVRGAGYRLLDDDELQADDSMFH